MLWRTAKKAPMPSGCAGCTIADVVQPRSSEKIPSSTPPIRVGSRTIRPWESHAARPDPTATATEKIVRKTVTTPSEPPRRYVTSGGNSDITSAPTSQNQLDTNEPHHSRDSARTYLISRPVEAKMLRSIVRWGAPSPVGGMKRLAIQDAADDTIISQAKWIGSPPSFAASPATMVPSRMARKVPPSTSALPAVNSVGLRWSGRMPYLIGPNSEAIVPYMPTAMNNSVIE